MMPVWSQKQDLYHNHWQIISRWVIPHRLDSMTFVGKDVFMVAHDIYIIFYNFKNNSEMVYVANNEEAGDGVDAIAGR